MDSNIATDFLEKTLQSTLEEAEKLSNTPSPEEKPFDNKYLARELLEKKLLPDSFFEKDFTTDFKTKQYEIT